MSIRRGMTDHLRSRDNEGRLRLTVSLAEAVPPILASPEELREVVENLVGNAIKYTPAGGEVTVSVIASEGEVRDTGIGIPPEEWSAIFSKFFRASNARALVRGGARPCHRAQDRGGARWLGPDREPGRHGHQYRREAAGPRRVAGTHSAAPDRGFRSRREER